MAALEVFPFEVSILDMDRFNRGVGANALRGYLHIIDPLAEVELTEDWESPLVRIGGHDFPGRVELALLGGGATLAVVQTWDIPRPPKYYAVPGAAELPPTMADDITGAHGYILAHTPSGRAAPLVATEIWDRNLTDFEHSALGAQSLLLQSGAFEL